MALRHRVARDVRREGVRGCLRVALSQATAWRAKLLSTQSYYVYRYPVPCVKDLIPTPRVGGVEIKFVRCDADADRLVDEGYEDPRLVLRYATRRIRAGAVGCLAYVDKEFASAGWIAFCEEAMETYDDLPYAVAFEQGEACTGGSWTERRFRGLGLYAYVFGNELRYIRDHGRTVCRNSIAVNNVASQLGQARYGARLCAIGRETRVFGWRRWVERPAEGACPSLSVLRKGN